ncbi:2-oxo acid dehydrogenase subunit E2 [soil metagenome]
MPHAAVRIPQIGEGLQEARLVAFLKQPGDTIRRDEPIYQMETDKAVMDVESPYDGTLVQWLAQPDDVLPIGAEVATMEVAEVVDAEAKIDHVVPTPAPAADTTRLAGARNAQIPPRTRAYAKEKGLSEEELLHVPSEGAKLMPGDIDAYLSKAETPEMPSLGYAESPLSAKQRVLASRLVRSAQLVVPGTISVAVNWGPIEQERARLIANGGDFKPSPFTMFAYAVARTLADFPTFRSSLVGDATLRTYERATLGIAVARPDDELVMAAVEESDALDWPTFAARMREGIEAARGGKDQASERITVALTNMQSFGLRDAVAVVVPPAVATVFLGEVYYGLDPESETPKMRRTCNIALTFDHRLINGVGAAEFLNAVKTKVETISSVLGGSSGI